MWMCADHSVSLNSGCRFNWTMGDVKPWYLDVPLKFRRISLCATAGFSPCQMFLFCGMHAVGYKGAIPDMIINMIFKLGEENSKANPISIKSEPRKPLLALVLDMFMFQLQHVKEPPTDDIFVWAPVCVSVSQRGFWIGVLPGRTASHSHFSSCWFNTGTA